MDKVSMMINARKLFKDISDLPTIPVVVSKVVAQLDKDDANPEEIADLILTDQVLAARVIRVVNSPLYRSNNPITTVKHALVYLGFKSVREMILTNYFIEGLNQKKQPFDMKFFWMHSFSVGALSRHIATLAGYPDTEKAYLVGMIHDIGKVFLGHYCKEEYAQLLAGINNTDYTTHEAEYEMFGTTHCEVGLCLAQRWNFPSLYCDVISYHHTSEMATEDPLLTAIISLADFFCLSHPTASSIAQASLPGRSEENAWGILKQLSRKQIATDLEHFFSNLAGVYEDVSREVDVIFNTMTTA